MNYRCPLHFFILGVSSLIIQTGAFTPTVLPTCQRVQGGMGSNVISKGTALHMNKKKSKGVKKKASRATPKGFAGALRDLKMNTFQYAGSVKAGKQSPQKIVLDSEVIMKPDYSEDGVVSGPILFQLVEYAVLLNSINLKM